jgi:three-Cys-motif partner protein
MSRRNDDFFKEKKSWSRIKDELLAYYLKPYTQKILFTHKPLVYVDCFAGKGKFEDGENGSPLIALEIINECISKTRASFHDVSTNFIDLNYGEELKVNLGNYQTARIISGKFEEEIIPLLESRDDCNIFLYIDPYGISALQYSLFEVLSKRSFNSIELLINLNSFGFIREACHVLSLDFIDPDRNFFDDLLEYDRTSLDGDQESRRQLTAIAGGDYWIDIIKDYKAEKIDGYQAEAKFTELYCSKLMEHYKYVLNIPVRINQGNHSKYRMIHVTNHHDGCLIMVDNMYDKWQILQKIQRRGQGTLFSEDFENQIYDEDNIHGSLKSHLQNYRQDTIIEVFLADFFVTFGVLCSPKDVKTVMKRLESEGMLKIIRQPEYTVMGKKSTFMESDSGRTALIRSLI